jgi:hypothetical protein
VLGKKKKTATEPNDGEPKEKKKAHPYAARVLMKLLYAARMARFDLLKPINDLACYIMDWDTSCDRRLRRLMCYVSCSLKKRLVSVVGDDAKDLEVKLFTDADFAGCSKTRRNTSGIYLELAGPSTHVPLTATSKRQRAVSLSTTEAEVIAASTAVSLTGRPAADLWDVLLGSGTKIVLCEDNQAAFRILRSGRSPALRHISRTQAVQLAWLAEQLRRGSGRRCLHQTLLRPVKVEARVSIDRTRARRTNPVAP